MKFRIPRGTTIGRFSYKEHDRRILESLATTKEAVFDRTDLHRITEQNNIDQIIQERCGYLHFYLPAEAYPWEYIEILVSCCDIYDSTR